jgi:hypothetical protein
MARVLILLVGEQPVPNLLPTRRLQPDVVVLVHTDQTETIAGRLRGLLEPAMTCLLCRVDPYDLIETETRLAAQIAGYAPSDDVVLNLTGGTKPMATAGLEAVRRRNGAFVYFQTEGNQSRLRFYRYDDGRLRHTGDDDLPAAITLDDYLRLHLGVYASQPPRDDFERAVVAALEEDARIDEVMTGLRPRGLGALEVDVAVRCGNQVGIGEIKTQAAKGGIDQINAVASREYLGTYVHKFLISGTPVDGNNRDLARAYKIEVLELTGPRAGGMLDEADRGRLVDAMVRRMSR